MATEHERPKKLAVLIDADNASPKIASGLFEEIAAIGEASVRRIYGDFSGTRLKGWSEVLSTYAIMPHQGRCQTKSNSSLPDGAIATDLLLAREHPPVR